MYKLYTDYVNNSWKYQNDVVFLSFCACIIEYFKWVYRCNRDDPGKPDVCDMGGRLAGTVGTRWQASSYHDSTQARERGM